MCILLGVRLTLPPSIKYTSVSLTFQTTALLSALQSWNVCKLDSVWIRDAAKRRVYCKTNLYKLSANTGQEVIERSLTKRHRQLRSVYVCGSRGFGHRLRHQGFKTKNTIKPMRAFLHVSKHSSHSVSKGFVFQQQTLPVTLNRQQQRFQQHFLTKFKAVELILISAPPP